MKPFQVRGHGAVQTPLALKARTTQAFANRQGQRVACLEGELWITQHRDGRDVVVKPGQCFVLDKPGLAIVFALKDALFTVGPSAGQAPCVEVVGA